MLYNLQDELSRKQFSARVKHLWGKGTIVELTDKSRRSGNQNRYLHVTLGVLALETGNTLEVIKQEIFKRRVNPALFVVEKDDPVLGHISTLRSSRDLNKEEMSIAIDRYRKYCSEQGVYIPSPEDEALVAQMEYEIGRMERYL